MTRTGYIVRASAAMARHPRQGAERIRGRWDRRGDMRELAATRQSASALYQEIADWAERLHAALAMPWPCQAAQAFGPFWDRFVADLIAAGARVGIASYGRWNDGDRAFCEAIWCFVHHLRPEIVVETGVAHGLTSRVILEGLHRNGKGHLWSIDLPAVDSAVHCEIGMAVPEDLRPRWSYLRGTARERLPGLLATLGTIDLFVHDSLHTGRNQRFELEHAWVTLQAGGAVVVDDIDHSLAFRSFVAEARPRTWLAGRHVTGPGLVGPVGLWGLAIKGTGKPTLSAPGTHHERHPGIGHSAPRAVGVRSVEQNPHYQELSTLIDHSTIRERQHRQIELSVVRQIALAICGLAPRGGRLLQIQPVPGPSVLLFRDQMTQPVRPVIYDQSDERGPEVRAATDFEKVDLESSNWPAADDYFDLVIWNRELVTVKNAVSALREVRRVVRPGGSLVLAVPNLAAMHNRLLLLAGRQPTALHIVGGDHVRGFAAASMTRVLEHDLGFHVQQLIGVGIAPVTSGLLPYPLRNLGHTVIWVLRKSPARA